MTKEEKLENLEAIKRKIIKASNKIRKQLMKLKETEEYDDYFDKIEYAEYSLAQTHKWVGKEIDYQTEEIMSDND